MKKIFFTIALVFSCLVINAQTKAFQDAAKAIEKAKAETENPKKGATPATWIKLAKAYSDAFSLPTKNIWVGATNLEMKVILKSEPIISSEQRVVADEYGASETFNVDIYADKELYYNTAGILQVINVTNRPYPGDLLDMSYDAYMKAFEVDPKGTKRKDIEAGLTELKSLYFDEAITKYTLSNIVEANVIFESSLKTLENPVMNGIDSMVVYYTAVTANAIGDEDKALKYLEKCRQIGYYVDGNVYGSLGEIYKNRGDLEKSKAILSEGFSKFPTNQMILISLINIFLETNDDPNKVLELIHAAQANEPNNPSLYWAEGNVYKNLDNLDKAVELYNKSFEINNNYIFGVFTVGATYYEKAIEIQEKAMEEMDDRKYEQMMEEMSNLLRKAIDPFEKSFSNTSDEEMKLTIATYLKEIYFRFRDEKPEYMERYQHYYNLLNE